MLDFINHIEKRILRNEDITFKEALKLSRITSKDELECLYKSASKIRELFCGDLVDLCTIMNAKSGNCSEDCKFCAQSAHYKAEVEVYDLVSKEDVCKLAKENEDEGVNKFSLVTSGRGIDHDDLKKIVEIYEDLNKQTTMDLCASLGILRFDQFLSLKDSGISMYHHNLEANKDYYKNICTSHSYSDRVNTIRNARKAGMSICSGGIIGMGESMEDRIKLAFELKKLQVESIPINILNPIKGTPLEKIKPLGQDEILKTVALFRMINPKSLIRLAGGRNLIDEFGKRCFYAGVNATITGNYLTTSGNKISDDKDMIKSVNLKIRENVKNLSLS